MATSNYPETDDLGFLNNDEHSKYRMLIGCGQWSITLGRLDVHFAIQTKAMFSAAPKDGHLRRMLQGFGYFEGYLKFGIIIDTKERQVQGVEDVVVNWNEQ